MILQDPAFITALAAAITGLGGWYKTNRDAKQSVETSSMALVKSLQAEVERLREDILMQDERVNALRSELATSAKRVHVLENKMAENNTGIRVLIRQLEAADITPAFVPSDQ